MRPKLHSGAGIPLMECSLGLRLSGEELAELFQLSRARLATLSAQSGGWGRFARSRGRIRRPATTISTAPARATKIA